LNNLKELAMDADIAKQKLIDSGLILDAENQGDLTRGHISIRVPGDPTHFFMKPHSFGFDEIKIGKGSFENVTPDKIFLVND
jgi:ribulose-5-phosphate 4-epimerase/fuculose-1-phosphate aldolase